MNMNILKNTADVTAIKLTPEDPAGCLGNGKQNFDCCCDECDFYLLCFPEFDPKIKEGKTAENS